MDVDVVVVGLIGITGTLLGTLLSYYLGERREDRIRKTEDWNKVVDEVYSPLIFDLQSTKDWGTLQKLRVLGKTIPALLEKQTKEQVTSSLTFILGVTNYNQSQMLEDTLRKNTRLIRPSTLWFDLAMFCDNLKHIEKTLAMLPTATFAAKMSKGLGGNYPDKLVAALNSYIRIGAKLDDATEHLITETKRIALMDKPPKSLDYQSFFNESIRKDIVKELDKFPMFLPNRD
jgi:hypothetical protein